MLGWLNEPLAREKGEEERGKGGRVAVMFASVSSPGAKSRLSRDSLARSRCKRLRGKD